MRGFEKWDMHNVGEIEWVNSNASHPHRNHFVKYVLDDNSICNILEIGGGELIEAIRIVKKKKSVKYTVSDVSSSFLNYANKIKRIKAVCASMHDLPFGDKEFDLVYLSSVIEHTPSIKKTIKELSRVSGRYYLTMFKWKMKTGDLTSHRMEKFYKTRLLKIKKSIPYYSTMFNLPSVFGLLNDNGSIDEINVSINDVGPTMSYEDYRKTFIKDSDEWRSGDRLNIIGTWRGS
tara:strand:- start:12871 stop:13569 length:699 start_codon:yes stop_codon:yes gene_type:complete